VKLLIIVNESPWSSSLALTACRFARAAVDSGVELTAVFFREDGVYNALAGEGSDAGTPDLARRWCEISSSADTRLLLCSSSRLRRFSSLSDDAFQETGLTELIELMLHSDRVVTF
jgi:tRNA 2-thiouridine synthesizing protein D